MPPRPQAKKAQSSSDRRAATTPTWLVATLAALVLLSALVPNWKSLGYEFVWDDPYVIGPHLDVRGWEDLGRIWNTPFDLLLKDEGF